MTSIKELVLQKVRENRGISLSELFKNFENKESGLIETSIEELIKDGLITFIWERYFRIGRQITAFDKKLEKLVKKIELPDLIANEIKNILGPFPNDPLYYQCYDINKDIARYFINRYKLSFDFEHNDYYLEAYFDNSKENQAKNNS